MLTTLASDRALCVVRAPEIPDPAALCAALVAGGIHTVEFTCTTPDITDILQTARASAAEHGALVGAGTVTTAARAAEVIAAGAQFIVTPGVHDEVAHLAAAAGVPVLMGAATPTEIMRAHALGAAAVKIFPATLVTPAHLRDLRGPFPDIDFVPSGGISAANAGDWIRAGALAATAGSSVVSAAAIAAADWPGIAAAAATFVAAARTGLPQGQA